MVPVCRRPEVWNRVFSQRMRLAYGFTDVEQDDGDRQEGQQMEPAPQGPVTHPPQIPQKHEYKA